MKPFLSHVAHDLYAKAHGDLSRTVVVFPGKRAGLFMNQYLMAETGGRPLFAPNYMTLGELFGSLTDLRTEDPIRLVCLLHRRFNECTQQHESIDSFYSWGELLLSDFDDIDKNLVNIDLLFRNLKNYKELTEPTDFLTEEQRQVLERFFKGFKEREQSVIRRNFLRVWQAMAEIYQTFRCGLEGEGRAYEGQLFRHVVEHFDPARLTAERYVFVGFNVLSAVERRLFHLVRESGKAMFYWDYDRYYLDNPAAEAGMFIRMNIAEYGNELSETPFGADLFEASPFDNLCRLPQIDIMSAPTDSAQAGFVNGWVRENITRVEQETAVVLADEKLIMPVLHALPMEAISDINVTMGMPMTETSVFRFLSDLVEEAFGERDGMSGQQNEGVGNNAGKAGQQNEGVGGAAGKAGQQNEGVGDAAGKTGKQNEGVGGATGSSETLRRIATAIDGKGLEMKKLEQRLQEEEEALYRAHLAVNSLIRLVSDGTLTASGKLLARLLMTILKGTKIPFHGEPAQGLQVMGVLETRNLDFSHLLVLSTNEKMLPKTPAEVSFIPFSLRKAFGLTTIERQTAVYAYYFYRLIQRADHVTLVYINGTDGMTKNEPSRFITQLEVEFPGKIRHFALQAENRPAKDVSIEVRQTADTKRRLVRHFTHTPLSPSAINTYYKCKLAFYLRYIEGLKTQNDDTEEITSTQFGTLFHRSAELAYQKLTEAGLTVRADDLNRLANNERGLRDIVSQAFRDEYWKSDDDEQPYSGIHYINFKAICIYLKRLLTSDARHAPFNYIKSEREISSSQTVKTDGGPAAILLGGKIDRLDEKDGTVRIIDYKTSSGKGKQGIGSIDELFDPDTKKRNSLIFQAFYYAWLMCREESRPISPSLFFVRQNGYDGDDDTLLMNKQPVTDFRTQAADEFEGKMNELLEEIFHSDVPYTQSPDLNSCKNCDFCAICGRRPQEY